MAVLYGLLGAAGCCLAPPALATGGDSIASAPTVAYGQQEFGNTLTDNNVKADCHGWSYWLLPVVAGDELTIDYEGQGAQSEALYPVGTNDFNVTDTETVQTSATGSNDHQQALYTVAQTGIMPLVFYVSQERGCGGPNGPYDFWVYDEHKMVLDLTASSNRRHHTTTFTVAVHTPDGVAIAEAALDATLEMRVGDSWVRLATHAQPFTFSVRWSPRERNVLQTVRAVVSGSGYRTATTSTRVKAV
jgi:hypothetical protein